MRTAALCLIALLTAGFNGAAGQTFAGWSTVETRTSGSISRLRSPT